MAPASAAGRILRVMAWPIGRLFRRTCSARVATVLPTSPVATPNRCRTFATESPLARRTSISKEGGWAEEDWPEGEACSTRAAARMSPDVGGSGGESGGASSTRNDGSNAVSGIGVPDSGYDSRSMTGRGAAAPSLEAAGSRKKRTIAQPTVDRMARTQTPTVSCRQTWPRTRPLERLSRDDRRSSIRGPRVKWLEGKGLEGSRPRFGQKLGGNVVGWPPCERGWG